MMSGASSIVLRLHRGPRGGESIISTLSRNVGTFFNSQPRSVDSRCHRISSCQFSSVASSSRGPPTPTTTSSSSFFLGTNHSPTLLVGANYGTSFISFRSLEPRANHGICLHRCFSDSDKSNSTTPTNNSSPNGASGESEGGSSQHNTWVQFQRSIAVSGFETGQTTKERTLGKKNRGGKIDRKRKEREAEAEALLRGEDVTQLKGGEFPALRYSDEETERLLAEAYAAIPPRGGKRGTLNLKRQKRRHFIKRQYHIKKKFERIAAHERRMAKRKRIYDQIKKYEAEAGDVRAKEVEYQNRVLLRWAEMNGHSKELMVSK